MRLRQRNGASCPVPGDLQAKVALQLTKVSASVSPLQFLLHGGQCTSVGSGEDQIFDVDQNKERGRATVDKQRWVSRRRKEVKRCKCRAKCVVPLTGSLTQAVDRSTQLPLDPSNTQRVVIFGVGAKVWKNSTGESRGGATPGAGGAVAGVAAADVGGGGAAATERPVESGQRHFRDTGCAGGNRLVQRVSGDNSEVVEVTDTHQVPRERGGVLACQKPRGSRQTRENDGVVGNNGSAKAIVTGVCSGVRSVQSRKIQLDALESRGPVVEAATGAAAKTAAVVAAAAEVATATVAATGAAAMAITATTTAATVATSKWHAITGLVPSPSLCRWLGCDLTDCKLSFTLDSGASSCFFRNCTDLTPLRTPVTVALADPSVGPIVAHRTTTLPFSVAPSGFLTGLPESLAPLPRTPAPPCTPCVEGRQRTAPHSSSFPPTTAPFQTLHLDVWGPSAVLGPRQERYVLIVVDDYSRYTTVFPLRRKTDVPTVLEAWLLSRGVRYAAHQLNLWPIDAWPRVTPVSLWIGSLGVVADFRVWCCLAHVRAPGTNKLSPCTRACVFLCFSWDASGRVFYDPPPPITPVAPVLHVLPRQVCRTSLRSRLPRIVQSLSCLGVREVQLRRVRVQGLQELVVSALGFPPHSSLRPVAAEPGGVLAGDTGGLGGVGGGGTGSGGAGSRGTSTVAPTPRTARFLNHEQCLLRLEREERERRRESRGGVTAAPGGGRAGVPPAAARAVTNIAGEGSSGVPIAAVGGAAAAVGEGRGGAIGAAAGAGTVAADARGGRAAATSTVRPARPIICTLGSCRAVCSEPRQSRYHADGPFHLVLRTRVPPPPFLPQPPELSLPVFHDPLSDYLRASRPIVSSVFSTLVTHPTAPLSYVLALISTVAGFASSHRLDYATHLVSGLARSPSFGGAPVFPLEVLEDRQFELGFLAAAVPHLCTMLLAPCYVMLSFAFTFVCLPSYTPSLVSNNPEGDPDTLDIPIPRTHAEAVSGPWASYWIAAEEAQMASYRSTVTYVDAVPPPGTNVVSGMWLYKVKRPPRSPPVFKAPYVARGFSQREGVDFFQTFAPTPKMTTLWVLLHIAAQRDYELHSFDFSTAFLLGSLHEQISLHRLIGFTGSFPLAKVSGTNPSVCTSGISVRGGVSGPLAPREWHDTLRTTLAALDFFPLSADPSLFVRCGSTPFFVLVYIDDLVLTRFRFPFSQVQLTPLAVDHGLMAPPSDKPFDSSGQYAKLVGCLM
ncbi:unnamed protein product [Closterium sp. NIES-53]